MVLLLSLIYINISCNSYANNYASPKKKMKDFKKETNSHYDFGAT